MFGQQTNSDIIHPILEGFKAELVIRGIDASPLKKLDSVNLVHREGYFETYLETFKNGRKYLQLNDVNTEHEFERVWRLHHELGHVFGLKDCYKCRYHFMSANFSKRGAFLLKDPYLRTHFFELFFNEIKTKIHIHL